MVVVGRQAWVEGHKVVGKERKGAAARGGVVKAQRAGRQKEGTGVVQGYGK